MDVIDKEKIIELGGKRGDSLVSIYMPAHKVAGLSERSEDSLRFKNLVKQVEAMLGARGKRPNQQARLDKLHRLREDTEFWAHQQYGLAVFVDESSLETLRLPSEFSEAVTVSDRFLTKPLLDFVGASDYFYVLAMSLNEVRLFRANRYGIEELAGSALPEDINDALGTQDNERILQHQPNANGARGSKAGTVFHGHGGAKDLEQIDLNRFVEAVAKATEQEMRATNAPLIFAGVEELFPVFKQKCDYKHLLQEEFLAGNHDHTTLDELHKEAVAIISPKQNEDIAQALATYRQISAKNPEQATSIPADIYTYAVAGKIESLVLATDKFCWGKLNEYDALAEEHTQFELGDVELLDQAAQKVLSSGGNVLTSIAKELPEKAIAVATLRY